MNYESSTRQRSAGSAAMVLWFTLAYVVFLKLVRAVSIEDAIRPNAEYIPSKDVFVEFVDRMLGEVMFYDCFLPADYPFLKFESYDYPVAQKELSDINNARVSRTRSFDRTTMKLSDLKLSDSGRYACADENTTSRNVMKLGVHDPVEFKWILIDRGMQPTRSIELGTSKAILVWKEWISCDGCVGRGERRRLGFCYVEMEAELLQCQDVRNLQFYIRKVAKEKKNEMLIETCYEACDSDENRLNPKTSTNVPVEAGDSLELVCPGNITARTSVRWERQYSTMLRKDFSFGYGPAQPYFVTKTSTLLINEIDFSSSQKILVSCVAWRQDRYDFELVQLPPSSGFTEVVEHLQIMAISCCIQIALFVLLLIVMDGTAAFRENSNVNRL